ncbi:MAG: phosphoenolpyruvate carboxykinase [Tissierellia bacterium]|nr:phosphoenolpyruvate carboxykinase [Tissierellia bacterium]
MRKEISLRNDKVIMNFSASHCSSYSEVLASCATEKVLSHFVSRYVKENTRNHRLLSEVLGDMKADDMVKELINLLKILTTTTSKDISQSFEKYEKIYDNKNAINLLVEEIYTYWRKLERYLIIFGDNEGENGLISSNFRDIKDDFDKLILNLYRQITHNLLMKKPNVYRQIAAGSNAGLILSHPIWAIPSDYSILGGIPFVKEMVLDSPLILYPKKNKRTGFFKEVYENQLKDAAINRDSFFCYPAKVGNLLAYVFVHKDFLTHLIGLANLFELANENEYMGKKPDIIYVMGARFEDGSVVDNFYEDKDNDIVLGIVSYNEKFDYFGYMKKMLLTCHNIVQLNRGNLPIHGAMVNIVLKNGASANIVIQGDSGAGKSETIEAFRSLAQDHIAEMTIIFDDMGTFLLDEDEKVLGTGTETGAFVRLDDLDVSYAFKQLDRAIFMNPDKINARLILPVASFEEISNSYEVDMFLYANNFTPVEEGQSAIKFYQDKDEAIEIFKSGKRVAKGTTQELGLTESYFANPFGPMQRKEQTDLIIDKFFDSLFKGETLVGEIYTQLSIEGMETRGPKNLALELFDHMNRI